MGTIDLESLLQPVSDGSPCGENLEYDAAYAEMEQAAKGKPEQQYGDTLVPAEEPDWRTVKTRALELLGRSKDLRVAVQLVRSLARTDGLAGLADGLTLLRGLVESFWDSVHPQLDPDDDNDPTLRVNTLAALADPEAMLRAVREAPLVSSRALGRFSLRDVQVASGALPPPPDGKLPDLAAIEAALTGCALEELQLTSNALEEALVSASALQGAVSERVGVRQGVNLQELSKVLKAAQQIVSERLTRRGAAPPSAADPTLEGASPSSGAVGIPAGPGAGAAIGPIGSRDDALRVIDLVCDYFRQNEPSSPVPILLERAKRLVSKSFLDIVRDLAPDGLAQVELIRGPEEGE